MKMFNFDNSYLDISKEIYTRINPTRVKSPELIIYNEDLSNELGIVKNNIDDHLSGNKIPEGALPIAQAYAGHQFGYLNILGDGRAILYGEHLDSSGNRFDIQLKGSGVTPYSRGGDGKATLSSMLREYIISYAMEHLNISTTKSLAVVKTGEKVFRDQVEEGAVLTRISSSFIRVGTFQYVALKDDFKLLEKFTNYVIQRHYPKLYNNPNRYILLLQYVMDRQIDLIVNWLRVGFIHGVMNTDNMAISGETIDYGPCAFMDVYDPSTAFSSIDRNGRYSYENQKVIGQWNLARFAETLIPLIDPNEDISLQLVNEVIESYKEKFESKWLMMMLKKIGFLDKNDHESELLYELLDIMSSEELDFTKTFRDIGDRDFILCCSNSKLIKWYNSWIKKNPNIDILKSNNPSVIPRNHIVERVLKDATLGNLKPLYKFLSSLFNPYSDNISSYYTNPPEVIDKNYKTYCGT